MSSTATRAFRWGWVTLLVVLVALLIGLIALPSGQPSDPKSGSALVGTGDELGLPSLEAGTHVWRAVALENSGDDEARITEIEAVDVPPQLHELGARVYAAADTDGFYTGWYEGGGDDDPTTKPSTPVNDWTLPAGEASTQYALVEFQIDPNARPGTYRIQEFRVEYVMDGRSYSQNVDTEFSVTVD